jgi:hypothetical protein
VGKVIALALVLASLAAIALLAFRPGLVTGVSEKAMTHAIRAEADGLGAACSGEGDDFVCGVKRVGEQRATRYRVSVDAWGCWEATPAKASAKGADMSGCVTVLDLFG